MKRNQIPYFSKNCSIQCAYHTLLKMVILRPIIMILWIPLVITLPLSIKLRKKAQNIHINVMRCAIWYQTLKSSVRMVGQNAVLTS